MPSSHSPSQCAWTTNELAVMLDCTLPLQQTPEAASIEGAGYQESFVR